MTNTNLTAAQMTDHLAATSDLRTARAELRARIATQMGRSICDRQVIREANAQLRNAGWRV